jgi:phosphoadenosine phosphosulfate reductase
MTVADLAKPAPSPRLSQATAGSELACRLDSQLADAGQLTERLSIIARSIPGRLAFSTSLGLEDQAVLHAISTLPNHTSFDVFTLDTGRHFPETLDTLDASQRRYGLPIRALAPEANAVEALVARDGVLGFRTSVDARKACCTVRKVAPLRHALSGAAAWITGLRREQAATRTATHFALYDAEYRLIKLNPLADWSLGRLEAYIAANGIPVNALHAQGYPSIGCQPCTRAIRPGEDIRNGRWWWEIQDGKECGLHSARSPRP